jgi:hypothetical protein
VLLALLALLALQEASVLPDTLLRFLLLALLALLALQEAGVLPDTLLRMRFD